MSGIPAGRETDDRACRTRSDSITVCPNDSWSDGITKTSAAE
jgi:hypothetical protein